MKTQNKIITAFALVATLALGSVAYAKKTTTASFEDKPIAMLILSKIASLGITDGQRDQVHSILHSHQSQVEPMVRQMVAERRALRDLIRGDGPVNEAAIRAQCAKVAALEADLAVARAGIVKEVKGALKPEQVSKLKEMTADVDARVDHALDQVAKRIGEK